MRARRCSKQVPDGWMAARLDGWSDLCQGRTLGRYAPPRPGD